MTIGRSHFILSVALVFALGVIAALLWQQRAIAAAREPASTTLVAPAAPTPPVPPAREAPAVMPTGELATYGAAGYSVAQDLRLRELQWSGAQFDAFATGLRAYLDGTPFSPDEATRAAVHAIAQRIREFRASAKTSTAEPAATNGSLDGFLQEMSRRFGLQRADSGLLFRVAKAGSGPRPTRQDVVTISFQATSPDAPNGLPQLSAANARLKVSDLMPGLAEGVQMLALDGAVMLLLPPAHSFGQGDWPEGIVPGTPLMFSVHLHDIEPVETAP